MPETGGMLFPCTVKEDVSQQRNDGNDDAGPGTQTSAHLQVHKVAQKYEQQNAANANASPTEEAKDRRKNPVKNFLE